MERHIVNPWSWQDAFGFVQANDVRGTGRVLLCSGQTSVDENGALLHAGDMAAQIRQALANLETVLGEPDLTLVSRQRVKPGGLFSLLRFRKAPAA